MKMYTWCTLKTNAFDVHFYWCSKGIVDVSHNIVTASPVFMSL